MSSKLKLYLGRKVLDSLQGKANITPAQLKVLIQLETRPNENVEMNLSMSTLERKYGVTNINELFSIEPDEIIKDVRFVQDHANKKICFEICRNLFVKDVLENGSGPGIDLNRNKIVVEYSSPNIAKPFHVGHLRSTIIGNFISNLHLYLNDKVTRLNYLGDWGTQFGFIKVGISELKYTKEQIRQNPTKLLYESYVHANKLGESDPDILKRARQEFTNLENGNKKDLSDWKLYVDYTKNELTSMYERLGVKFDEYHRESMYNVNDIQNIINTLTNKNILQVQSDGKMVTEINERKVSVVKSDGTSLYLTRDIAAAIDRFQRYNFDKMFYVVENGQTDHFNALKAILTKMDLPWADRLHHVKFGRIRGMSTRKGTAVFLRDILDECRDLMVQKQLDSPTTRVPIKESETSDILGVSCVIVNDLKQRRQKDYDFSWDKVLQIQGDTGIKLQYTHCRLCSLEEHSDMKPAKECIPEMLIEKEAITLVKEIARFNDVIDQAVEQLEACLLVTYLFHLCNHINRALKTLQVKGTDKDIAAQRLLLFNASRETLRQGMSILGLKPLNKM